MTAASGPSRLRASARSMSARTRRLSSPVSTQAASAASFWAAADEFAGRPVGIHRTDDAGSTTGEGREDEESRRFHLEVHDALARHVLREVRVADGQLGDRAPLRTEEPRCRRRHPDVVPVSEPLRSLDERRDRLVVGDRGIPVVDEEARGRLEAHRARCVMTRSPRPISGWSAPHDPTRMKVGRSVIARISATTISTLSVPMPVETTDTRWPRYRPVAEANSRCRCSSSMDSKREAIRRGPIGVTGEEDVLGQFAWTESDVVLPFSGWDRDPAIRRAFDAVVRVRQDLFLAHVAASLARNSAEDSPAFSRASSRVDRAWPTLSRGSARRAGAASVDGPANVASRAGDPGRQPAPRLLPAEEGHGQRSGRDRQRACRARRRRHRPANGAARDRRNRLPAAGRRRPVDAGRARRLHCAGWRTAPRAIGSPAWTIAAGSSTDDHRRSVR